MFSACFWGKDRRRIVSSIRNFIRIRSTYTTAGEFVKHGLDTRCLHYIRINSRRFIFPKYQISSTKFKFKYQIQKQCASETKN